MVNHLHQLVVPLRRIHHHSRIDFGHDVKKYCIGKIVVGLNCLSYIGSSVAEASDFQGSSFH
jgi:hypothetical protein